jgi:uncharacterized FlaG/YvyC family protein
VEAEFMGLEIINHNPDYKTAYVKKSMYKTENGPHEELPPLPGSALPGSALPGSGARAVEEKHRTNIDEAVEKLRSAGDLFNKRLDFRVDEKTNRIVVKVIDTRTDKVIKEIPPEQLLHLAAKIQEMVGLLVDEER